MPVSLIGAFAGLLAMGYSANTVSLLALVLAIGIVVDDAIVVVENVERVMSERPDLSPGDATKEAMRQITGPIIAITLVLLSVFVPIAFIPGISGQLFRQFAVTISVAMLISALNALTLSPALCAVFLRHTGEKRGIMGRVMRGIDNVRDGYAAAVGKLLRLSILGLVMCAGVRRRHLWAVAAHAHRLPAGGGPGRLLRRRAIAGRRLGRAHQQRWSARSRRWARGPARRAGHVRDRRLLAARFRAGEQCRVPVLKLKPFADRTAATERAQALIGRMFGAVQQVRSAVVFPFNLPPIIGLSTTGGFEYQLDALEGQDATVLGQQMNGLLAAANSDPRLARVFSTFTATNPSLFLDIDRQKAQALGLSILDVFTALAGDAGRHLHQRLQPVRPGCGR